MRFTTDPTIYADAPLARVLSAMERGAPDLDAALTAYVRARRAAGVHPDDVIRELERVVGPRRRAADLGVAA